MDVVVRSSGDELLVFQSNDNLLHYLNPTAALLWRLCDGKHSRDQMIDRLQLEFGAPREMLLRDVADALHGFAQRGLITPQGLGTLG